MRTPLLIVAALLCLVPGTLLAEIAWRDNLRTAREEADATGKLLLLHFYTDNCHWCDKLEEGAFRAPTVNGTIDGSFVPVKIDAQSNPKLVEAFRVSRFPTDVIVTTDGTVLSHGISPQAETEYVAMLNRHTGRAAINAAPASPPNSDPQTQIASDTTRRPQTNPYAQEATPQPSENPLAMAPPSAPVQGPGDVQANRYTVSANQNIETQLGTPTTPNRDPSSREAFGLPPQFGTAAQTASFGSQPHDADAETMPASAAAPEFAEAPSATAEAPSATATSADPQPEKPATPSTPELALQGYCPVAIVDNNQWLAGNRDYGLIHLGKLYLFTSSEAMESFQANPEAYTPVMNGLDVVIFFNEHRIVEGKREFGLRDPEFNRMFFFANEETLNHFYQEHQRYTRPAIEVTRQAATDANEIVR